MTLKNIIDLLDTDEFTICKGDQSEEIRIYEKGSYKELKKYYNDTVVRIIPITHSLEIHLSV